MAKESRCHAWTALVYLESAPDNWRDFLDDQHIEWVESPLHEFDVNPTGEVKKPHWHILLTFTNVKSYDQIVELLKPLNGTVPQRCHNQKSLVRYFAHLDNPDKFQYDISQIVAHGGLDITNLLKPGIKHFSHCIIHQCSKFSNITFCYKLTHFFDDGITFSGRWFK